jgi:hypothetical protein
LPIPNGLIKLEVCPIAKLLPGTELPTAAGSVVGLDCLMETGGCRIFVLCRTLFAGIALVCGIGNSPLVVEEGIDAPI